MDVQKRLGTRVRDLRLRQGITQEQLAERCDCTVKFISTIERGKVNVPLVTLARLARELDVTISELSLGIDEVLPRDLETVEQLLAGRPTAQQTVIVSAVRDLLDATASEVAATRTPRLRAAERRGPRWPRSPR